MKPRGASSPPLVSVLLPVCNGAATLPRALASLRAQTLPAWELLLVNNGSTDATAEMAEAAARRDQRIRVLDMESAGLVAALNQGLVQARGEYVARLDADDEMHPDRLAAQTEALVRRPAWGLAGCLVEFGGDPVARAGYADHVAWLNRVCSPAAIWRERFVESPFAHPSVMWRRSVHERWGGYRAGGFPEDYDLWLRWLDAGVRMGKVERPLVTWHDSPGRLSRTDSRYRVEAFFDLKARYLARELVRSGGGREVWVAGAGRPTRQRAAALEIEGARIEGYADVDPRKIGGEIAGRPVVAPANLPPRDQAVVLSYVGNRGARDKVRAVLEKQGREEGVDFWLCA